MSRTTENYIHEAFNLVCKEAKVTESWYVCLMERVPFYGGPEEGGWWGSDTIVEAYQEFASEELAHKAAKEVEKLALELSEQSKRAFGEQCLREMDWLEARGLEANWLPEPDGDSTFYVQVCQGIPEDKYGSRGYE